MSGNYPDGVNENTRGAPWNEHKTVVCVACDRIYYPDTRPHGRPTDNETNAPLTDYGAENELCETCELETDVCVECNETRLASDGRAPHVLNGCASCRTDPPCVACGAPLSVCECNGTVDADAPQCVACGARQFVNLGSLGNVRHYRCRNCGSDSYDGGRGEK